MPNIANLRKVYTESTENLRKKSKVNRVVYKFQQTYKNPNYRLGSIIPLRACLLHNISSRNFVTGRPVYDKIYGVVQSNPKWITILSRHETTKFENVTKISNHETNDLKASKHRMIQSVQKFCDYYEPLYQSKKVSIFFFTFTRANYSDKTIATMLECVKRRLKSLKWHLRAYLWVFEAKENAKMEGGFHLHYHLVIVVNRVNIDKIPDELKMDELWGQLTNVEFIKYTVKGYLSKYLYKTDAKVCSKRRYGVSRKFI